MVLHDYQKECVKFILNNKSCALYLTMGLGKSLITLTALYNLQLQGKLNHNVLIIGPKTIVKSTWIDEIEKWNFPFKIDSFVIDLETQKDLSKKERIIKYSQVSKKDPKIYFINRELVPNLIMNFHFRKWKFPFKTIVIDESQSFKSYSSQRFKALKAVQDKVDRFILLSGTPIPNGLEDIWSQIYLLDGGKRLGKNITAFRNEYFIDKFRLPNGAVIREPRPGAEKLVFDKIKDIALSLDNTMLKLPDRVDKYINIEMNDKETKLYKTMKKDQILEFLNSTKDDDVIVAQSAASLSNKLSQMASGTIYTEDGEYKVIHKRKLDYLKYLIENTNDNILISYWFKSDLEMLEEMLQKNKVNYKTFDKERKTIDKWNNGKYKVMLIQPLSAGHGLNLQKGGNTLVWYTIPWSSEAYKQTNARLHRQGQNKPVTIYHLLTKGTIDEKKIGVQGIKEMTHKTLMKELLPEILKDK